MFDLIIIGDLIVIPKEVKVFILHLRGFVNGRILFATILIPVISLNLGKTNIGGYHKVLSLIGKCHGGLRLGSNRVVETLKEERGVKLGEEASRKEF